MVAGTNGDRRSPTAEHRPPTTDHHNEHPLIHRLFRNRYLILPDVLLLSGAALLAFCVRFEGWMWLTGYRLFFLAFLLTALPLKLAIFHLGGLYRQAWRFAGVAELERIIVTVAISGFLCGLLGAVALPAMGVIPQRVPLSVLFIDAFLTAIAVSTPRLLVRIWTRHGALRQLQGATRVLIAGAGKSGEVVVKELLNNPRLALRPIGFVDDDPEKQNEVMGGVPVLGGLEDIPDLVEELGVAQVVIAMPSAPGQVIRRVVELARQARVPTRTVPRFGDILSGRVSIRDLRPVQIEDLLRREPVQTDLARVRALAERKTVLVTGAGGSIGSELCRQIGRLDPAHLVLVDHDENAMFDILEELKVMTPRLRLTAVVADIRDAERLCRVFDQARPHTVFHAAAHKHVPLMEDNVAEAVLNNVLGTRNVAEAALQAKVGRFVLISTDKAVRPISVMGATKRVAELLVRTLAERHGRNFTSVRFGNVLGSAGSVLPTFLRQIRAGGPVTVTDPEMRRYFMTIPEAVQLTLQAGALGRGGEVFVLDMGVPVRILDLATDLIRLSGLEPGRDVEIRFTGVRPGEKLHEELFFDSASAEPTEHPKILVARDDGAPADVDPGIERLLLLASAGVDPEELQLALRLLVGDYQAAGEGSKDQDPTDSAASTGTAA